MARKVSTKQSEEKPATVGEELQPGRPQRLERPELKGSFIRLRSKLLERAKDKVLHARYLRESDMNTLWIGSYTRSARDWCECLSLT